MMANADLELDKENTQTLQQAIHLRFGTQNASEPTKSHISIGPKLVIPQLKIPQINASTPTSAEVLSAEEHRRAADAHNERLLNAIKRRREQSEASHSARDSSASSKESTDSLLAKLPLLNGISCRLTIPKLRTASGEPLDEPQFNIPLLNKLRSQNNSLELTQLEKGVSKLKLTADDGGDSTKLKSIQEMQQAPTPLIDLTSTVIAIQKDAPPREAASKVRHKQAAVMEHFDIPFIGCDSLNRVSVGMLFKKRQSSTSSDFEATVTRIIEKSSDVGSMLDATVGYPRPRQPQLRYAASPLELQNLKMYKREDYGTNIKRFRFDTASPDEIVKEALQKSWRISRT
ncbi:uncharacterized protein LOC135440491 [Drosophila montana]|uniref:uncharacterized protein LOC135440491 n=1 Tax=Drosophila montana TaxID=40370 RepID=UPI00313CA499